MPTRERKCGPLQTRHPTKISKGLVVPPPQNIKQLDFLRSDAWQTSVSAFTGCPFTLKKCQLAIQGL